MPTQAEIDQQIADTQELSAAAIAEVTALAALLADDGDQSALLTAVPELLGQYMSAASELAVEWYRSLARDTPRTPERRPDAPAPIAGPTGRQALAAARDFQPRPAPPPPLEQIEASVRWALRPLEPPEPTTGDAEPAVRDDLEAEPEPARREEQPEPVMRERPTRRGHQIRVTVTDPQEQIVSRLSGVTQRYVTTAARDTISANASAEGVRWVRHAQPDACAFCRMLATRSVTPGNDYLTEESARRVGTSRRQTKRKKGELYHDVCKCEPVPVRAGDVYEPPEYVTGWTDQYYLAVDHTKNSFDTKAILAQMRVLEADSGGSRK